MDLLRQPVRRDRPGGGPGLPDRHDQRHRALRRRAAAADRRGGDHAGRRDHLLHPDRGDRARALHRPREPRRPASRRAPPSRWPRCRSSSPPWWAPCSASARPTARASTSSRSTAAAGSPSCARCSWSRRCRRSSARSRSPPRPPSSARSSASSPVAASSAASARPWSRPRRRSTRAPPGGSGWPARSSPAPAYAAVRPRRPAGHPVVEGDARMRILAIVGRSLLSAAFVLAIIVGLWVAGLKVFDVPVFVGKGPREVWEYLFGRRPSRRRTAPRSGSSCGRPSSTPASASSPGMIAAVAVASGIVLSKGVEAAVMPVAMVLRSVPLSRWRRSSRWSSATATASWR